MNEKFWKQFQMLLLIAFIGGVNFETFHPKHYTEKIITK